jgi:acetyl esterase/lipase
VCRSRIYTSECLLSHSAVAVPSDPFRRREPPRRPRLRLLVRRREPAASWAGPGCIRFRRVRTSFRGGSRGNLRHHLHGRLPPALVRTGTCPPTSRREKAYARSCRHAGKDEDRADAHRSQGDHPGWPSTPGLSICLHVHAVVQGTPAIDPIPPRCRSVRRRTCGSALDDAGGAASDSLSWRGRPRFLQYRIRVQKPELFG